jgi:hypothetical protein
MEWRERDLLRAMARFLADYCGEEALHRWWEKLSEAERQALAQAPRPLREICQQVAEALGRLLSALQAALSRLLRACAEVAAAAWRAVSGGPRELFGEAF